MPAAFETGFFVSKPAWHGLGNVIMQAPSIAEGIKLAGLDWGVELWPTTAARMVNGVETRLQLETQAVVRTTDNRIVGEVGPSYQPLQNAEAFDFFQPFIDANECELHTAGSLFDGRKIWVLAKIRRDNAVIRGDDEIAKFVMLSNSHDGTCAVRVGFTPIRIVCANTLAMAHSKGTSNLIRVRHRGNVQLSLEKIRETIDTVNEAFNATAEQYRWLASRKNINQADLRKYVKVCLNMGDKTDDELSTRAFNIMENVELRFTNGMGNGQGSWWDAYNAITEYLSYEKGNNADNRINNLWFGTGFDTNKLALETALTMAA